MKNDQIRLLLSDLDGTLLQSDHLTVSGRTRAALRELKHHGVLLCACTGRVRCTLPPAIAEEGFDFCITSNGAACTDLRTNERIFSTLLDARQARLAYETLRPYPYVFEWYVRDEILLDRATYNDWQNKIHSRWHKAYLGGGGGIIVDRIEDFWDAGVPDLEKLNVLRGDRAVPGDVDPLVADGSFHITGSVGTALEISGSQANKGEGLKKLCAHLGMDEKNVIAFGDGRNDGPMLRRAGLGIAMANSTEETKTVADAITLSNDDDGVADYLEKYIL